MNQRESQTKQRKPYERPIIVRVQVDPVTELLQASQCNFDETCPNPCA